MYDIVIIGMGIAGLTAGIYAKRSNRSVLIIEKAMPGGILNRIDKIENYPGVLPISGPEFAEILLKQAECLEIPYVNEEVLSLEDGKIKKVITKKKTYEAKVVIIASGRSPKGLGLAHEEEFMGKGISTCALCDGAFYKNKVVAVVGGGNSALQEALYLSNLVSKLYIIHRRNVFRADEKLIAQIKAKENIEILYNEEVKEYILENEKLVGVQLLNQKLMVEGVFLYVGQEPKVDFASPLEILDSVGYVLTDENCKTSCDGIYAIGDARKRLGYQLVTAAYDGYMAIMEINRFLNAQN